MYTYNFSNGIKAELKTLERDEETGLIRIITWHCFANNVLYGYVNVAQRPVTNEFYIVKAQRMDTASWITGHLEGLLKHCMDHFADEKSQGSFFVRENGVSIDGDSSWEV